MGKFGPLYLLKKHGDLPFLMYFFETDIGRESSKKSFHNFFFLRNHLKLITTNKKKVSLFL